MCDEQLLWIGSLEEKEEFNKKLNNGFDQTSAQLAQEGIISGIEAIRGITFDSINGSVVNYYPKYKSRKIDKIVWCRDNNSHNVSVGFLNLKYISKLVISFKMKREAVKWVKDFYRGDKLTIFVYSLRSAPMTTALKIKKLLPNSKLIIIISDLPQYMDLGESKFKSLLKKIDFFNIKKMLRKFNNYILYADKMSDFLALDKTKCILMEGFYNSNLPIEDFSNVKKSKSIFYSGMLSLQYGIDLLLESFAKIDDENIELWLAGTGNAVELIQKFANKDRRIKYFGLIPREDVLYYQKQSTCLINMRLPSTEVSKYSFPSKIFEYLVSGTPTLSFKLDGIPEEYYNYLIEIESEEQLTNKITEVLNLPISTLNKIGNSGRDFILKNKNVDRQSSRICNFVWGDKNG